MLGVVSPGETVSQRLEENKVSSIGSGLARLRNGQVIATLAGPLLVDEGHCWVSESSKRYLPKEGDVVIGTIVEAYSDQYLVDIQAPRLATLDILAFDGATRRNSPTLEIGALVFARVLKAESGSEPRLTCEAPGTGKKKDWTTGETEYGELKAGCVFNVSRAACRRLSISEPRLFTALTKHFPFEVCIGFNGKIWIDAEDRRHVVLIAAAARATEGRNLPPKDLDALVDRFVASLANE